jgi:6-phosphogluconolactonase
MSTSMEILPDAEALALRTADVLAAAAQEAAAARGRFAVALSGGETPKTLYRMLARQQFSQKIPWRRVQLYWGDERCVAPDDPASNYGMARDTFIKHVPIPADNVHRLRGEDAPEEAARAYEAELRALAAKERPSSGVPVFDLVLLGLGPDGHVASLFPRSEALLVEDSFCVATEAPDGSPRLTITAPVINSARRVWLLVSGAGKAGMVAEVLEGLRVPNAVPAQGVAPVHGTLTWFLDEAAAAELSAEARPSPRP